MAFSAISASVRRMAVTCCAALLLTAAAIVAAPQAAHADFLPQNGQTLYYQSGGTDWLDSRVTSLTSSNASVLVYNDEGWFSIFADNPGAAVMNYTYDDNGAQVSGSFTIKVYALNTEPFVMYPGKQATIKASGVPASWKSSNSAIAKVTKAGKITAKSPGRCTMRTKIGSQTLSVTVDVASKKAYKAVKNARYDATQKLKYNKNKRTQKKYRDCSSFASRCYWDTSLKRKLVDIGGNNWPLTAADQAEWLNKKNRCVAKKAVDAKYLQPGDTIYFETGYMGKNNRYRHIDHAGIYLGGGMVAQTASSATNGCIRISEYYSNDSTIRFIGRPTASVIMNKTECTLTKAAGSKHTVTLKPKFNKSKKVKWSTSNAKVAKVSKKGVVTARGVGSCRIYAKVDGKKASCVVTVA